tara:strand:- start:768 stop:950 length:183 start_codon:yes stop_codon:yes gene_type:complete
LTPAQITAAINTGTENPAEKTLGIEQRTTGMSLTKKRPSARELKQLAEKNCVQQHVAKTS